MASWQIPVSHLQLLLLLEIANVVVFFHDLSVAIFCMFDESRRRFGVTVGEAASQKSFFTIPFYIFDVNEHA